jgi:hypothetical protein
MKTHYFKQEKADADDIQLEMAKEQGYVPWTCLLGGMIVMSEINKGRDPCGGCNSPREKCHGRKNTYPPMD